MTPLRNRQENFAVMMARQLAWMADQQYHWTMGDVWRSTDKLNCPRCKDRVTYQELLVHNKKSQVLHSRHNDRCAMDVILWGKDKLAEPEEYRPLGEHWEELGGIWGGRFGIKEAQWKSVVGWDPGHFEL